MAGWLPSPPSSAVTQSAKSVVATQKLVLAHDTFPFSALVSEISSVHVAPPSEVPRRASVLFAPVAQQCAASPQEMSLR